MQLTIKHVSPTEDQSIICDHCDERIEAKEDYKYVKLFIGSNIKLTLHERPCFLRIVKAQMEFYETFIGSEMKQSELVH